MTEHDNSTSEIDARVRAVERLTALFRMERMVYLGFGVTGFAMLIACLIKMLLSPESSAALLGAFGSSGTVAFTGARVLVMWNRALSIALPSQSSVGASK